MEYHIIILLKEEENLLYKNDKECIYSCNLQDNIVIITLEVKENTNFQELLSNKEIKSKIEKKLQIKENINILDNIREIELNPTERMANYIEKNPIIKTKDIILLGTYQIDNEQYSNINPYFYQKAKVYIDGNNEAVTIKKYKQTVDTIERLTNEIKESNLSPFEQVMYTYDLVRDRVYNHENEYDLYTKSRDISQVLLGEKIVCVGYSRLFNQILKSLNISSEICSLNNKLSNKKGHCRNAVYIKDHKYNINGVYYFDTTWDSKKNKDDNTFLNSYKFFANTKNQILQYTPNLIDSLFIDFDEDLIKEYEEYLKKHTIYGFNPNKIKIINKVSIFITKQRFIDFNPKKEKLSLGEEVKILMNYLSILNPKTIDIGTFIDILYNVRAIENQKSPEKYPFNKETFKEIIINSGWLDNYILFLNMINKIFKNKDKEIIKEQAIEDIENYLKNYSFKNKALSKKR